MRIRFAAAICAALLAGLGAGIAQAGEVKGPPTALGEKKSADDVTAAPARANSICAYSGLNDDRTVETGDPSMVQTPAGSRGAPGDACRGGSNEDRFPD